MIVPRLIHLTLAFALCGVLGFSVIAADGATTPASPSAELDKDFAAWKATLSPEQQAWETILEHNLGKTNRLIYERAKVAGQETEYDYTKDDPKLPRVLLIGDSISCGYTLPVRRALAGIANVHRAPENCGTTENGVKKLSVWLDDGKWDVIHFNFGIHDRRTPIADYEQRLDEITTRLVATGAKIIWASTTPIPADTTDGPTMPEAIVERNAAASDVMHKHQIPTDDLFGAITPVVEKMRNPQDAHYNPEGYEFLGQQVARTIKSSLAKND
ncbi:MAG TPA: SGNH/GDSL hydrolase family protein [Chthoniobacter sp.]|jgi:lysophospholipase L1-like esterase